MSEIKLDFETFPEKLDGYEFVEIKNLKLGEHYRYVCKEFKKENLKCIYCILKEKNEDGSYEVSGYGTDAFSWKVVPVNKWRTLRFYRRVPDKSFFGSDKKKKRSRKAGDDTNEC